MKTITIIFCFLTSLFLTTSITLAATTDFEARVSADNDDAEEEFDGDMYLSSTDLELVNDGTTRGNQTIGIRFTNIAVPRGATISKAYLEFRVDETENSDGTVTIAGQAHDDPPQFTSNNSDISSRSTTSASATWILNSSNEWSTVGDKETTMVSSIVQEIVSRPGWSNGQSMVFIISGSGKRVAESYEGSNSKAPLLHIEYDLGSAPIISVNPAKSLGATSYEGSNAAPDTFVLANTGTSRLDYSIGSNVSWLSCDSNCSGSIDAGNSVPVGVSYDNFTMSAGSYNGQFTITDSAAKISPFEYDVLLAISSVPVGSTCGEVPIYAQNLVDPAILVLLDVSGSMTAMMPVASSDANPKSPDISSIVQEIVNQADWDDGNSMAFIISGSGKRVAEAYDDTPGAGPLLKVEYEDGTGTPVTLEVRVDQSNDDAEEKSGGAVVIDSSDLELVKESTDQTIGIRFQNITIPQGSSINSASLEFVVDETEHTDVTNLIIAGEYIGDALAFAEVNNNISNRPITSANVPWVITDKWDTPPEKARYVLGREAISELVEDESISWGYGTWAFNDYAGPGTSTAPNLSLLPANPYGTGQTDLYTKIRSGINHRTSTETTALKAIIDSTTTTGGTPFGPSLLAAREYYAGNKADLSGNTYDSSLTCQPKFLIDVTDGLGYTPHTTVDIINKYTNLLADEKISSVAVGFGIDNATQITEMAKVANARGVEEGLYALHENDVNGDGLPFIAQNKEELVTALGAITNSIKNQLFIGSSPAPSTSVDSGTFVINASFNASTWSGDLWAKPYDPETGAIMMCVDSAGQRTCNSADIFGKCLDVGDPTCPTAQIIEEECLCWTASDMMPTSKNAWTVDGATSYSDSSLPSGIAGKYVDDHTSLANYEVALDGDNYICKDLGDIIKSTPVIVESPKKYFSIDNYRFFKFGSARGREKMLYVGANDGALHALNLRSGEETWRFYPEAVHDKLINNDICGGNYCHEYFVDGTATVEDVYLGKDFDNFSGSPASSGWRTLLINGLGAGGDSYFALDITSAKPFVDNNTDPLIGTTYRWQFEDAELGLAMSQPVIARLSNAQATFGGWGAVFGSGYNTGFSSYKEAYVYGIEAYTAADLWLDSTSSTSVNRIKLEENDRITYKAQTGTEFAAGNVVVGQVSGASATVASVVDLGAGGTLVLSSFLGNFTLGEDLLVGGTILAELDQSYHSAYFEDALSNPFIADLEFDNIGDYLYIGNMYGRMYRLHDIGKDQEPKKGVLFDVDPSSINHNSPIRAGASVGYDSGPDTIWVYFGTGKFEEQADKFNTEQQYFIGVKDYKSSPVSNSTRSDLLERSTVAVSATFNGETKEYRTMTGHTFAYDGAVVLASGDTLTGVKTGATGVIDSVSTLNGVPILKLVGPDVVANGTFLMEEKVVVNSNPSTQVTLKNHPWYAILQRSIGVPSERVVANALVAGGVVFFTSFIPDQDVCGGNGAAWLYALDYETGLPPAEPVFDINGDGKYDSSDVVTSGGNRYFPAAIPIGRGIPSAPVLEGDMIFVNTTDTARPGLPVNLDKLKAKVSAWKDGVF